MKTILITSQKGGSGKTMLAAHLAVEAERSGNAPAWIIDTDRQATLTRWHERREAETPQRGEVRPDRLSAGLATLAGQGGAFCFIDTAPTLSDQTAAIIEVADLIVIPVRPSPSDLWAVADTVQLVKEAGKPFLFVVTQAKSQARITAQAIAALSEHGRVAKSFISDSVGYAAAMTSGNTAPEISPTGPVAAEVAALWEELKACFQQGSKERKVANG
jgi:chromosome partitioning protein